MQTIASPRGYLSPRNNYKIIIVGGSGVGKSKIIKNFLGICSDIDDPTIGVEFYSHIFNDNEKFLIWDLSGHRSFQKLIETYYNDVHGIILVFDLTVKRSFDNISNWYQNIEKKTMNLNKKHILLLGNKVDKSNRMISSEDAQKYADDHNMIYCEVNYKSAIIPINMYFEKIINKPINNKNYFNCINERTSKVNDYINFTDICLQDNNINEYNEKKCKCCSLM